MPSVARVLHQGLAVDKPTADATLNQGWMYFESDTGMLKQSWNGAWTDVVTPHTDIKIGEVVVGAGGQASIDFAAIPGTFTHLQLIGNGRGTAASTVTAVQMRFNGDSGSNYDYEQLYANDGNPAAGYEVLGDTSMQLMQLPASSSTAGYASSAHATIADYANAVFHKSMLTHMPIQRTAGTGNMFDATLVGFWHSTSPITDIHLFCGAGNFAEGTKVSLYGIV